MRTIFSVILSLTVASNVLASDLKIKQEQTIKQLTHDFNIVEEWKLKEGGYAMAPYSFYGINGSFWVKNGSTKAMSSLPSTDSAEQYLTNFGLLVTACGEMATIALNTSDKTAMDAMSHVLQQSIQDENLTSKLTLNSINYEASVIDLNNQAVFFCEVNE